MRDAKAARAERGEESGGEEEQGEEEEEVSKFGSVGIITISYYQ